MFARVTTLQGSPDQLDQGAQVIRERVLPAIQQAPGFKGFLALADRSSGKVVGMTLWEDEQAMQSSEQIATQTRDQAAEATGGQVLGVDAYEVILDERMS